MSRFNAQPDGRPEWGREPFPAIPCDIFDANGVNVGPTIACDTETGLLLQHVYDTDGLIVIEDCHAATVERQVPAPLRVIPRLTHDLITPDLIVAI